MKEILKRSAVFPIISIVTLLQFCAPSTTPSTSGSAYQEDLSIYREEYETPSFGSNEETNDVVIDVEEAAITPTEDIKMELDTVISRIVASRKGIKTVDGYTIQLYSGSNRDLAYQIKARVYEASETLEPKVAYDQPNYKVRTGKYYTRLEANPDFELLKKKFSRAVLIPAKIKIE